MIRADPGPWPLIRRELQVTVRRRRLWLAQGLVMVFSAAPVLFAVYLSGGFSDPWRQPQQPFGRTTLMTMFSAAALLFLFLAPGVTATAITEERERRTLDLLLCTRMRPRDVVLGKLASGGVLGLIMLSATLPVAAFCTWWGGVKVVDLVEGYALGSLWLVMLLGLGLWASSRAQMARQAVAAAYIVGATFMPITGGGLFGIGLAHSSNGAAAAAGVVALTGLMALWLTAACVLGAITSISPASRDPAPGARRHLVLVSVSSVVAAALCSLAPPEARNLLSTVLLCGVAAAMLLAAVLFLTEDTPARQDPHVHAVWRAHPLKGLAWVLACAGPALTLSALVGLRGVAAPAVSAVSCAAMVPWLAGVAGLASLTRLLPWSRTVRRLVALGGLVLVLLVPPVVAWATGQSNLALAPPQLLLWMHPVVMLMATQPAQALTAVTGPWGMPFLASFVLGHLVVAAVSLPVGLLLGRPSARME